MILRGIWINADEIIVRNGTARASRAGAFCPRPGVGARGRLFSRRLADFKGKCMTTLDSLPPAAALPREYMSLTARLDALGARFRLAQTLRAVARFLALCVPVCVAGM